MRVLVTGATGFIGGRLVRRLRERGARVRCLVRDEQRAERIRHPSVELVRGDVRDRSSLHRATRGIEAVLHVAGVVRSWRRRTYFAVNADGTRALAEAARASGAGRFLLVSSLAASGPGTLEAPATEDGLPRPVTAYGQSKLAGERWLGEVSGAMSSTIVRPCAVYGPGDRDVLALFRLARRGIVPYAARAGARLSLIHVDDLVDLVILAFERGGGGRTYLATDGGAYLWDEVIDAIARAVGRPVRAVRVPPWLLLPAALGAELLRPILARPPLLSLGKVREAMAPGWVASAARARDELGWSPALPLASGMRSTAEWYREQGWLQ